MSFKNETILWLRDIRHFFFKVPTNRYARFAWLFAVGMFLFFLAIVVLAFTVQH